MKESMKRFIKPDIVFYIFLLLLGIGGFFFALIWPQSEGFYAFTISASLGGLGVVSYIFYSKKFNKQLACPSGSNCDAVIKSKYSHFLGIPLEYLGMLYYSVIFFSYTSLIFLPYLRDEILLPFILMLTASAFLFSLYLIFVQAFLLRKWCIWCLLSAALSTGIFIASFVSFGLSGEFFDQIEPLLVLFRELGFIFGLGGATAALFLFLKFLNDSDIDDKEAQTLQKFSELIWFGLGLIFISEYTRYVSQPEVLAQSGIFISQIVILSVVFISGAVLNVLFAPFLAILPFSEKIDKNAAQEHRPSPLESLRRGTIITGAIAISSWYFAFALNYIPELPIFIIFAAYGAVISGAIIGSLLWEQGLNPESPENPTE